MMSYYYDIIIIIITHYYYYYLQRFALCSQEQKQENFPKNPENLEHWQQLLGQQQQQEPQGCARGEF